VGRKRGVERGRGAPARRLLFRGWSRGVPLSSTGACPPMWGSPPLWLSCASGGKGRPPLWCAESQSSSARARQQLVAHCGLWARAPSAWPRREGELPLRIPRSSSRSATLRATVAAQGVCRRFDPGKVEPHLALLFFFNSSPLLSLVSAAAAAASAPRVVPRQLACRSGVGPVLLLKLRKGSGWQRQQALPPAAPGDAVARSELLAAGGEAELEMGCLG